MRRTLPFVLGLILTTTVSAQAPEAPAPHPPYRLSIVIAGGGTAGGPAEPLLDEMTDAGYDMTSPEVCGGFFCSPAIAHPYETVMTDSQIGISARYVLKPSFVIGAGVVSGPIGGATGLGPDGYVTAEWKATSFWTAAYLASTSGFRLGVGPSFHKLTQSPDRPKELRFGITGEAGLQFPQRSRLFIDVATRYHFIPTTDVEIGTPGSAVMTSRPHWSHFNYMFGLGIRG